MPPRPHDLAERFQQDGFAIGDADAQQDAFSIGDAFAQQDALAQRDAHA